MKCIIVDDEPLAREIMESYVEKVPFLRLIASCKNAFEALDKIQQDKPDLIFLDIQMPDLNGIQFYESLVYKPLVIFTTAYSDYAVSGFDLDATDYLVKPFSFDRFIKAVNKARSNQQRETSSEIGEFRRKFMFVKDGVKIVRVSYDDILFFEGMKDYVKIVMNDKFILTLISMQHMADKLPKDLFVRVHRSFIVSIPKIEKIEKNRVVISGKWIPVGNSYKSLLTDALGQIN